MKKLPALLSEITGKKLSNKVLPLWLMYLLLPFMQMGAKIKGELPLLTKDMLIAAQLNPNIKNEKAVKELGFSPRGLQETFTDTIEWYKSQGWL